MASNEIQLTHNPKYLTLLERLVEAIEKNNELLNVANNRSLSGLSRGDDEEMRGRPKGSKNKKVYVRKTPPKEIDDEKLMALYEAGWTYAKIAEEVGCSHTHVGDVVTGKYGNSIKFSRKRGKKDEAHS